MSAALLGAAGFVKNLGASLMIIQLTVGPSRQGQKAALSSYLAALTDSNSYTVEVKQYRRNRSCEQNKFLWGVVYRTIIDACDAPKPEADHLHEYWLGECFGWSVCDVLGWSKKVPVKRSSKLTTLEFIEYYQFIQRRCSETMGLYIEDPNEKEQEYNE